MHRSFVSEFSLMYDMSLEEIGPTFFSATRTILWYEQGPFYILCYPLNKFTDDKSYDDCFVGEPLKIMHKVNDQANVMQYVQ